MTYNFERWPGKRAMEHGRSVTTHVSFNGGGMYISTGLLNKVPMKEKIFDLMVDKERRVFALKFHSEGQYKLTVCPAQVGVGVFIREFKPVTKKRIHMKRAEDGMWIGNLDGGVVPSE